MPGVEVKNITQSLAKTGTQAAAQTIVQRLLDENEPAPVDMLQLWQAGRSPQTYRYTQWLSEAARYAAHYATLGAKPGDNVVIVLRHGLDLYAAVVGAWLGGFVPSVWAFPSPKVRADDYAAQLDALLKLVQPGVIVTYPELHRDLSNRAMPDGLQLMTCEDLSDSSPDSGMFRDPAAHSRPDDIALLQFSSGTTGLKKGVALSHRAVLWQVDHYAQAIQLDEHDRIVSWLPLYHDMGLIACLIMPLMRRVPVTAMCPFEWAADPNLWLQAITTDQATLSWLPNFAYNFMAQRTTPDSLDACDLSSLRAVVNCSEPVQSASHAALLKHLEPFGLRSEALTTTYALAENTFAATVGGFGQTLATDSVDGIALSRDQVATPIRANSPRARTLVSSGQAMPETKISIVDEDGVPLPDRHVGEIVLRSPCLLSEYFQNAEATQAALRDGQLFTGDLGYRAEGELYVIGRRKEMLIIRGTNIFPQDIEAIVNAVDGVIPGRVAAVGVPNETAGTDELVIIAETNLEQNARVELANQIRGLVARRTDLTPAEVFLTEHMWLRKSTAGKISRNINRDRYLAQRKQPIAGEPGAPVVSQRPDTQSARSAARRCVSAALHGWGMNAAHLAPDQPLITSGLIDSLALTSLFTALESETGQQVNAAQLRDLAPFDTLARVAEWIRTHRRRDHKLATKPAPESKMETPADSEPLRTPEQIPLEPETPLEPRSSIGYWTRYYRWVFWRHGITFGPGLRVLGRLLLRLDGDPRNISLGTNVTLMPGVELKVRENGRIILHDAVALDSNVRLVAAREGRVEVGAGAAVGMGTVINAGAPVVIGRGSTIGGYSLINASEPAYQTRQPILEQPYEHSPIYIDEDVYGGFNVFVNRGSHIGRGAVLGVRSSISGKVPPYAVMMGDPARIVRWRGEATET